LLKRIYLLPFIIAINRKVGLKKAPSCLSFTASMIKIICCIMSFLKNPGEQIDYKILFIFPVIFKELAVAFFIPQVCGKEKLQSKVRMGG